MITHQDGLFCLNTPNSAYLFRVTKFGHLEHVYFGRPVAAGDAAALSLKHTSPVGGSVVYDEADPLYCLDDQCLEWSGIGRGDYRHSPAEIRMPDGTFTSDFVYQTHEVMDGCAPMDALPTARGGAQTLVVTLADMTGVVLKLYYTLFEDSDVIARRCVLENNSESPLTIRRLMSLMLDVPNHNYTLTTFDGAWLKETHRHDRPLQPGLFVNSSTTGNSSNRHNPGFLLAAPGATEEAGEVLGFNLVYSGNHYGAVELSPHDLVRVQLGISPHCFEWTLAPGEAFETPQALLCRSDGGFNGLSAQFHDFVNRHIVPEAWQGKERPVLVNSWEACFFNVKQRKLLRMARMAKKLGAELFVLDDGWFGARDSDTRGLGDYSVNRKKLPGGLDGLAAKLRRLGLDFGLWMEPEMVSVDSDLYRGHPDWAVATPGRRPCLGRHQLVLDLCRPEVCDYIVAQVGSTLDSADIRYVKWDMNRNISDAYSPALANQGEFYHRYILALYGVLCRIFEPRPHILLETCASGGNRFDLGMLCFGPQVWASDCTDPVERLDIQGGLSYLYPQSTWGAHVSDAPHQQTLRDTPLSTRFGVAAFGCLGYEMDLTLLSRVERAEIASQIAFYKAHRRTFQFGRFSRVEAEKPEQVQWQCAAADGAKAVTGWFQKCAHAAPGPDWLRVKGLAAESRYRVTARAQKLFIKRFGGLLRQVLSLPLKPDGVALRLANRVYALDDCADSFEAGGSALESGIALSSQYMGTEYNDKIRMAGDFSAGLYLTEAVRQEG